VKLINVIMLTKSDFINYIKCPVYLWLTKHQPDLLPEDTLEKKRILEMGREVDILSRCLFPGGIEVGGFNTEGWQNTKKLMASSTEILFQPTIVADPLICRADILTRNNKIGGWDINEVKMATSIKKEYAYDLAFQRICFKDAGIRISRTNLIHINNQYIRKGNIEPEKLFISEDISDGVDLKISETKEAVKEALRVAERRQTPDPSFLQSCSNPKTCEYLKYYCEGIPSIYSIAQKLSPELLLILLDQRILSPEKIPADLLESIGYEPKIEFTTIDAPSIRKELEKLQYPLYFLDYETYGAAIPPFDGCRPWQNIPFQYSLIVKETPTATLRHTEFLMRKFENPVPAFLSQLKRDVGSQGSIIVWNAPFEKKCNEEMARMEPGFADFLKSINERIFDLMVIFKFKNQLYIKSGFQKSASLKKVIPVLCPELSYESLAFRGGGKVSASWPILTNDKTPEEEKSRLAEDMLAYCKRDTEAMVSILNRVCKDINVKI